VAYWLLYANQPGHGLPQSTVEHEDSAVAGLPSPGTPGRGAGREGSALATGY
jgi:hypothetical protein